MITTERVFYCAEGREVAILRVEAPSKLKKTFESMFHLEVIGDSIYSGTGRGIDSLQAFLNAILGAKEMLESKLPECRWLGGSHTKDHGVPKFYCAKYSEDIDRLIEKTIVAEIPNFQNWLDSQ
jgi:hypothetical protein